MDRILDPAQAIYGWSADTEDEGDGEQFVDMQGTLVGKVTRASLSKTHRTSNESLLYLMSSMRKRVLAAPSGQRLKTTWDLLDSQVSGELGFSQLAEHLQAQGGAAASHLVLYRRRVDALAAVSYLREKGVGCKLRLGGLPRVVAPGIGLLANQLYEADVALDGVSQEDVNEAWRRALVGCWLARDVSPDEAWSLLRRIAPAGKRIDMKKVAARLAAMSLPDEVFSRVSWGPTRPSSAPSTARRVGESSLM